MKVAGFLSSMNIILNWTVFFAGIALGMCSLIATADSPDRPNVVIILADDMGYSDPACFGGEIATPNLDKLARNGVRLTRFYNGGMCVVSRASMLTGNWWPDALRNFRHTPLLSEKLHESGYRTGLIGKWHLDGHPMDRGFDHFFGFLAGFADHFSGCPSYQLDRASFTDFGPDFYSSDAFTDRAIEFVKPRKLGEKNAPFFLYLSFQAPHNPLQAPREVTEKYRGKYSEGWQSIRQARFERQKKLGIVPADSNLPAYPLNLPEWHTLAPAQRELEDLRMAVYAAMVDRMDENIGRLLKALEKNGQSDNTLILFLSDNGADSFSVVDQVMLSRDLLPGDRGSNWQPGTGWAYASVTPWRMYKIGQHGGGVTTGAIACWPGRIQEKNRIESVPLHMVDVLPTILDAASVKKDPKRDGASFLNILHKQTNSTDRSLFFQYMDNRAIRTSNWTLAEVDGEGWELFDTTVDPLETVDLADSNPQKVKELETKWLSWWCEESGNETYRPTSTKESPHYKPQGDRGSGVKYFPSAMPASTK